MNPKGQTATWVIPVVVGLIIASAILPVLYLSTQDVYTPAVVTSEPFTMAATPAMVNLAHNNIQVGSVSVSNSTGGLVLGTAATAAHCGNVTGQTYIVNTCYYNVTYGNSYTIGTVGVNRTGDYLVNYTYYPPSYSASVADRALMPLILTFIIIAAIVIIAKLGGFL